MSLAHGVSYLAIPGPSVTPERVLRAMHRTSPNIYEGALPAMMPALVASLKAVARTEHNVTIYITNGHGAWEAALTNTLSRGDRILVPATGRFSHGWAEIARVLGVEVDIMDFGKRDPIAMAALTQRLKEDDRGYKAVLAVHTDTSTSLRTDIPAVRAAIDAAGHPALLMVDCMASLGCDRFEMDAWGVDVMLAGSQKGLMTPPGLAFVWFNDKADRARDTANCVTWAWDWRPRAFPKIFSNYFGGTAPTLHLHGLREALDMIEEEGLENVWSRHATLARAVWAAAEHWGTEGTLELNVRQRELRGHSVTAFRAGSERATALRRWCEDKAGLTLGIGLGMAEPDDPAWHHFFRLGHMGHVSAQMILGALATMEAGMKAVGLPHAPGGVVKAAEVIAAEA